MKNHKRAGILFALAALAWFVAAALLPAFRVGYGALGLMNLVVAAMFFHRHRSPRH